jgi:hypothetical protein
MRPDASPETHPDLDAAAGFAVRYFADKIAPTRVFRLPDGTRSGPRWRTWWRGCASGTAATDDEALQSMVFAVGKEHGFEPLRDWFKALYEVLLGASDGPRFGGFIALYGVDETVALMERALLKGRVGRLRPVQVREVRWDAKRKAMRSGAARSGAVKALSGKRCPDPARRRAGKASARWSFWLGGCRGGDDLCVLRRKASRWS